MKQLTLLILSIVAFEGWAFAATSADTRDGLVRMESRSLDKFYVRPGTNLAPYSKVMIDPVRVEFSQDWLRNVNDSRYVARIRPEDARRIADETTADAASIISDAFRARGYQVVTAAGPGVLRVSPRVAELYVNAPDVFPPGITRAYTRDAGEATLVLEVRDAASGTLMATIVDHGTATDMLRLSRATQVSNTFWFDDLYKRWAERSVAQLDAIKN